MLKVTLRDNSVREVPAETRITDILNELGGRLKKEALAAVVNGVLVDLNYQLTEDADLRFVTFADDEGEDVYRHSSSHILAAAVKRLYKDVKLGIGLPLKMALLRF